MNSQSSQVSIWTLGRSAESRPLEALAFAPRGRKPPGSPAEAAFPWVLCLGAVHGDEREGAWLMAEMRSRWLKDYPFEKVGAILWEQVNPDGLAACQRLNSRGVDLNRNLPTRDWSPDAKTPRYYPGPKPGSEPENQALMALIGQAQPIAILSAHSFNRYQVNSNGRARAWAEKLAEVCAYPVTEDIGYPTPGCLGTYAGFDLDIPTITLEIEDGLPRDRVLGLHAPLVEAAIQFWENR